MKTVFEELLNWVSDEEELSYPWNDDSGYNVCTEDLRLKVEELQKNFEASRYRHDLENAPKDGRPFIVTGGTYSSATSQIHGFPCEENVEVVWRKPYQANREVDSPFVLADGSGDSIWNPDVWKEIAIEVTK